MGVIPAVAITAMTAVDKGMTVEELFLFLLLWFPLILVGPVSFVCFFADVFTPLWNKVRHKQLIKARVK